MKPTRKHLLAAAVLLLALARHGAQHRQALGGHRQAVVAEKIGGWSHSPEDSYILDFIKDLNQSNFRISKAGVQRSPTPFARGIAI